jgi:prevent-host-death family protein
METMPISKFKATCLAALDRVRKTGRPLLVTKRGVPIAQVVPPPKPEASDEDAFGSMAAGTSEIGDIVEPLSTEDWEVLK